MRKFLITFVISYFDGRGNPTVQTIRCREMTVSAHATTAFECMFERALMECAKEVIKIEDSVMPGGKIISVSITNL